MQGPHSAEDPRVEELRSCVRIKPNLIERLRILQYAPLLYRMVHTTSHRLTHRIQHFGF